MFLFQISDYDDPVLDTEAPKLLHQRLEEYSRRTVPGMWKVTDRLNAHAANGPGRETRRTRYRVYGVFLLALGVFALIPGLMEPRMPALIGAGALAIISGILEFCLARKRKPRAVPKACRKEAEELLSGRRAVDWSKIQMKVCFDENSMTVSDGKKQEIVPYDKMTGIFETDHLWLVVYDGEKALLLQKKDLLEGPADEFRLYLLHKILQKTTIGSWEGTVTLESRHKEQTNEKD